MNRRVSLIGRLRRIKSGAARCVVTSFAVAYLSAGVAPCAMAATRAVDEPSARQHAHIAHDHAGRQPADSIAHSQHGHDVVAATFDGGAAPADEGNGHCPHCPPGAQDDHAACVALEELTNVAASSVKDVPQPHAPTLVAAVLMLPPLTVGPWPPPPLRAARVASVPLNVRHCIFLI